MDTRHQDRLENLLSTYAEQRKVRKLHPMPAEHRNWAFRDRFSSRAREVIVPTLQQYVDQLRGKVQTASVFHRTRAAGLTVRADAWQDYDRELVFFSDEAAEQVHIAHEGRGFAYETLTLPLDELTAGLVEVEVMAFLDRVLELEPLGLPFEPPKPAEVLAMPAARERTAAGGEGLERRLATAAGPHVA